MATVKKDIAEIKGGWCDNCGGGGEDRMIYVYCRNRDSLKESEYAFVDDLIDCKLSYKHRHIICRNCGEEWIARPRNYPGTLSYYMKKIPLVRLLVILFEKNIHGNDTKINFDESM